MKKLAHNAFRMSAAVFISRVTGLLREQLLAVWFGATGMSDAFLVAFRLPNLLRDLFAEGSLSAVLVPIFIELKEQQGPLQAWTITRKIFRVLFFLTMLLACLGVLTAPWLVRWYAGSFYHDTTKFLVTVQMTQIMFFFLPAVAMGAAWMGILNAEGVYFWPALASSFFNVTSLVVGWLASQVFAMYGYEPILGLSVGVVVGGWAQAFFQLPFLWVKERDFKVSLPFWDHRFLKDPYVIKAFLLLGPGITGLAATQINILVNTILATRCSEGSVSLLNYAYRLMQFPMGVISVSLSSAIMPILAHYVSQRQWRAAEGALRDGFLLGAWFNIPAMMGLYILAEPIISLIFQYGRFSSENTTMAAQILRCYAIGLPAYTWIKLLVPFFYTLSKPQGPVIASVLAVVANIILSIVGVYYGDVLGLAAATSGAAYLHTLLLGYFMILELKREPSYVAAQGSGRLSLIKEFVLMLLISGLMSCLVAYGYAFFVATFPGGSFVTRLLRVGASIFCGVVFYSGVSYCFRLSAFMMILDIFKLLPKKNL